MQTPGVAIGGQGAALFMPAQHVFHTHRIDQGIVQRHDAAAGVSENRINLVALKCLEYVLCAVHQVCLLLFFQCKKKPPDLSVPGAFGVFGLSVS